MSEPDTSTNVGLSSGKVKEISSLTGASFTGSTVSINVSSSDKDPSLTVTVISMAPFQFSAGVMVNWSPINSAETNSGNALSTLRVSSSSSISPKLMVILNGVSSRVSWLPISESSGASLTGKTVISTAAGSEYSFPSKAR